VDKISFNIALPQMPAQVYLEFGSTSLTHDVFLVSD
jgi:hypothetical protein